MDPETTRLLLVAAALAVNLNALAVTGGRPGSAPAGYRTRLGRLCFLSPTLAALTVALLGPPLTFVLTSIHFGLAAWPLASLPVVLFSDSLIALTVASWIGVPRHLHGWYTTRDRAHRHRHAHVLLALLPLTMVGLYGLTLRPRLRTAALIGAIERRDLEAVRAALDRGADPNRPAAPFCSDHDDLPLNVAVETGDNRLAALLLARGADARDADWRYALNDGDEPMASLLLAASDKRYWCLELNEALISAAKEERPHKVRFLLQHGADPNVRARPDSPNTLLRDLVATGRGDSRTAEILRAAGAHE